MIACPECGQIEDALKYTWKEIKDGRRQLEVTCPNCHRWIKWAPQKEPYLTYANRNDANGSK